MPPNPTADICARVPPHIRRELQRLMAGLPRSLRQPSYGDMVGALLLAARRAPEQLPADLTTYFEIKDAWTEAGRENLPDVALVEHST